MATFHIVVNGETKGVVPLSEIDPNDYNIVEQISPSGYATAYLFRCGNFVYKWDQDKPGGDIKIYEENGLLMEKFNTPYKLIKEIPLRATGTSQSSVSPTNTIPTPPPPPAKNNNTSQTIQPQPDKQRQIEITQPDEKWTPPKTFPGSTPQSDREKLVEEIKNSMGKKPSEIKKEKKE